MIAFGQWQLRPFKSSIYVLSSSQTEGQRNNLFSVEGFYKQKENLLFLLY